MEKTEEKRKNRKILVTVIVAIVAVAIPMIAIICSKQTIDQIPPAAPPAAQAIVTALLLPA